MANMDRLSICSSCLNIEMCMENQFHFMVERSFLLLFVLDKLVQDGDRNRSLGTAGFRYINI